MNEKVILLPPTPEAEMTMPRNILNLPAYTVLRVEETEHDYHVYAEATAPLIYLAGRELVQHECKVDGTTFDVVPGEPCNWCGEVK